ncbi:hypothetical protein ALC57_18805 [Trachymyrmex cornetzi]|uniref:Reverse transcriptase/retrotransposon-derived protein RNase H-like domain-containing protein n=1 Tax=Trachymyrmex cornetzi TaxID=471704 RepID=A0A151IR08_9HYME|nr:hypothetical protein ALC57_18805 [Trachymyrmex cornetzi]
MAELTLGEILPNKLSNYTKLKDINALYFLFYGENVEKLVKLCTWFQFEVAGSKEKLAERLCMRLTKLSQLKFDEEESEDKDNDEYSSINDDNANGDDGKIETKPTTNSDAVTMSNDEARQESRRHKRDVQQQSVLPQSNDEQHREDDLRRKNVRQQRIQFSHYPEDETQRYSNEIQLTNEIFYHQKETKLHIDASSEGYRAVLLQRDDTGQLHPVQYMSKKTMDAEKKKHSYELEVLAVEICAV